MMRLALEVQGKGWSGRQKGPEPQHTPSQSCLAEGLTCHQVLCRLGDDISHCSLFFELSEDETYFAY